jgi:hypothetical protein
MRMKKLTIIAAIGGLLALTGCQKWDAVFEAPNGGPPNPAVLKVAKARCNEQYFKRVEIESIVYGQFGDYVGLIDDAKACMLRQGVRVVGFRQPDGRIEAYPNTPKWMTY